MNRAIAIVVLLAANGCGSDAGEERALSPERYRQLERMYEEQVRAHELARRRPLVSLRREFEACGQLDAADALLGVIRAGCEELSRWGRRIVHCQGQGCLRAIADGAEVLRRLLRLDGRLGDELTAARVPAGCGGVLSPPGERPLIRDLLEAVERFGAARSAELLVEAQADIGRSLTDLERLGSPRQWLTRFRNACRSP